MARDTVAPGRSWCRRVRSRAQDLARPFPTTRILGTPRAFLEQHRPDRLLAELGLDAEGLAAAFKRLLADQPEFAPLLPESPRPRTTRSRSTQVEVTVDSNRGLRRGEE